MNHPCTIMLQCLTTLKEAQLERILPGIYHITATKVSGCGHHLRSQHGYDSCYDAGATGPRVPSPWPSVDSHPRGSNNPWRWKSPDRSNSEPTKTEVAWWKPVLERLEVSYSLKDHLHLHLNLRSFWGGFRSLHPKYARPRNIYAPYLFQTILSSLSW